MSYIHFWSLGVGVLYCVLVFEKVMGKDNVGPEARGMNPQKVD